LVRSGGDHPCVHRCCGTVPCAFFFRSKLIKQGINADPNAVIDAFRKNEQVKKVFWTLFMAMAGLMMAQVIDPLTAQQVVGKITRMGGEMISSSFILRR
jgi:hypothetical protein